MVELSDGRFQGICGNDPPECGDIDLLQDDIEVLGVEPERLCKALRRPLCIGGKIEALPGLQNVYRVGSYKPEPSIMHPVYFVVRCTEREYSEAFDALRSQLEGGNFVILVPTDRFTESDTIRQMVSLGIPIIALHGLINLDTSGQLTTAEDVLHLFGGIGRYTSTTVSLSAPIVAQVRTHNGWQDLDEPGYSQIIENIGDFDIVADERNRVVWKHDHENEPHLRTDGIRAGYFNMIRGAVEKIGYFNPDVHGSERRISAQQIFQRARQAIDVKYRADNGSMEWRLFKTVTVEDHGEYHFHPDPDYRFALIFLPRN